MRKRFFISFGVVIAILALLVGGNYLLSLHNMTFTLANEVTGATIYQSDKQKVKQIDTKNTTALLKNGDYYIIPEGSNISQDKITFTVSKNSKTLAIDPSYTKEYLTKQLTSETAAIKNILTTKYPSIIAGYTLKQGTLYKKGDWFGGLLAPNISDIRERKDPYRVVLHKKDGKWEVIRRPEYILTSSKYPDVPVDVLRAINQIAQVQ